MVFGRLFGGDTRLAAQKAAVAAFAAHVETLDRWAAAMPALRTEFAEVWPAEGPPDQLLERIDIARDIAQLLGQRVATARRALEDFDSTAALLEHNLPIFIAEWHAFSGLLLARHTIAIGKDTKVRAVGEPSIRECQQALLELADRLFANLRAQFDELTAMRPRFKGPGPEQLDLPSMEAWMLDIGEALETYRERLGDIHELPGASTGAMHGMILRMESRLSEIEHWRPQLVVHTVMTVMLDRSARGPGPSPG